MITNTIDLMIQTFQILWSLIMGKQHNLRQFNLLNLKHCTLLNLKQCTGAPSNIQHANVQARVYVRAKAKLVRAFICEI